MLKTQSTLILLIILISYACHNESNYSDNNEFEIFISDTISLKAGTITDYVIDQYKDTYNYKLIKLESNPSCIIGEVSQLKFDSDSNLYILDKITKSLFKFDKKGNYEFKINNIGRGPGEYINIATFYLSCNQIILHDEELENLLFYDLNGSFKKVKSLLHLDVAIQDLAYLGDSIFAFTQSHYGDEGSSPRLLIYDMVSDEIDKVYFPTQATTSHSQKYFFYKNNNKVTFKPLYENYAVGLNSNGISNTIFFDFGKNNYPEGYGEKRQHITLEKIKDLGCVHEIFNIVESEDMMAFCYYFRNFYSLSWYSYRTKKSYTNLINPTQLINLFELPIASIGEYFVGVMDASTLVNLKNSMSEFNEEEVALLKDLELPANFQEITMNANINDNPYLLFYKVREPEDKISDQKHEFQPN